MVLLRQRLSSAGYITRQFSYHSVLDSPAENAGKLNELRQSIAADKIHYVCHSLGGLVVRHLFEMFPGQTAGRVVTLGTPHQPSSAARQLSRIRLGELALGKSTEQGLLGEIPPWDNGHELGSIAGNLRLGLGMIIPGIPEPSDGTVAVEETRFDEMKDHIIINASHFGLLISRHAAKAVLNFINNGNFRLE